jgi:hypothetical protein
MYAHRVDPEFADKAGRAWVKGGAGNPDAILGMRDAAVRAAPGAGGNRSQNMAQTFKLLNALAAMHQGTTIPKRLGPGTVGLRYFSARLRDGSAARWERSIPTEE